MSTFTKKMKEELLELIPPTLFFFLALHVVALMRALMIRGTGITAKSSLSVTIAALVLGKSVLIADLLPAINRFPHRPLAYNVVWKTLIYVLVASAMHYLENLIDFWRKTNSFIAGNKMLLAEIVWPHFISIQILLTVIVVMYVTMRELVRVIGGDTVKKLFFGPLPALEPGRSLRLEDLFPEPRGLPATATGTTKLK